MSAIIHSCKIEVLPAIRSANNNPSHILIVERYPVGVDSSWQRIMLESVQLRLMPSLTKVSYSSALMLRRNMAAHQSTVITITLRYGSHELKIHKTSIKSTKIIMLFSFKSTLLGVKYATFPIKLYIMELTQNWMSSCVKPRILTQAVHIGSILKVLGYFMNLDGHILHF